MPGIWDGGVHYWSGFQCSVCKAPISVCSLCLGLGSGALDVGANSKTLAIAWNLLCFDYDYD